MSDSVTPKNRSTGHPSWCCPETCTATRSDIFHSSPPVRWVTLAEEVQVRVRRTDETAFPDETRGTLVELTTLSREFETPESVTDWTPAAARVLAYQLLTAAALAGDDAQGGGRDA